MNRKIPGAVAFFVLMFACVSVLDTAYAFLSKEEREARRKEEAEALQKKFEWWPTDAKPGAVKDEKRGGYWWWPKVPGKVMPWGNRGYVYVYKIIFDYQSENLPAPKPNELRPSLLIRKVDRNIKVYFDYDKSELRSDATGLLREAVTSLEKNPKMSILVEGNADIRGTEQHNLKLSAQRAETVKNYLLKEGVAENRIKIISHGKLNATAPVTDLVGMQKDRNAQFMIADVEEVMLPYQGSTPQNLPENAKVVAEDKYLVEKKETVESAVKVSTRTYVIKAGDTLSKIAARELGSAYRWEYLYEINRDTIKNPNKLRPGQKITIPVE